MNCARCGAGIPEDSPACPGCGLKLKAAPTGPPVGPPRQAAPPPQHFSPGDASAPGSFAAPHQMPPPGIPGGPWPGGPPAYGPVMKDEGLRTKWLIAAGVSVLVIMAVLAVVYFLVLNKKTEATGPEGAVLKYFDAISAGDVEALKSMYSPETMPPQASLDMIGQLFGTGMIKYEDIKLKTIKETATDAEVQLLDARITVTVGGQKTSSNVSDRADTGQAVFKLKMVNGYWLIYQDGQSPVDLDIPAFPGGAAPSGG